MSKETKQKWADKDTTLTIFSDENRNIEIYTHPTALRGEEHCIILEKDKVIELINSLQKMVL